MPRNFGQCELKKEGTMNLKASSALLRRLKSEDGALGVIIAAVTLPVAIFLMVAAGDFARMPVSRDIVKKTLISASYGAESHAFKKPTTILKDDFPPAANSFCGEDKSVTQCLGLSEQGGGGFLNVGVSKQLADAACELSFSDLQSGGSGLFSFVYNAEANNIGIRFAVIRLNLDPDSGTVSGSTVVASSQNNSCEGSYGTFIGAGQSLSPSGIAAVLEQKYAALGQGAGAWFVQDDFDANPRTGWERDPWLPSYWLVGVAYLKVDHFFGGFFGQDTVISDYFIRPFNAPMGIQTSSHDIQMDPEE